MPLFCVQLAGPPAQPLQQIEAQNVLEAVRIAAGCHPEELGPVAWRRGPRFHGSWQVQCFTPSDGTGREWLVHFFGG